MSSLALEGQAPCTGLLMAFVIERCGVSWRLVGPRLDYSGFSGDMVSIVDCHAHKFSFYAPSWSIARSYSVTGT